ncbi:MAG TPA: histidine kinase [Ohtaekwangia sp.]|uniref:sensor histidine kinase n=1 Tax=Ohtaekwangia sp. TaxID=2066019 RepID=UPI002F92C263
MDISFVFSNELKFRLARHAAFWGVMIAYQWLVDFIVPAFLEGASYAIAHESFFLSIVYLPGQLLLTYGILYIVIPRCLLQSRYIAGAGFVILFCVLAGVSNEFSYRFFTSGPHPLVLFSDKHSLGLHRMLGVAGFAACIKYMKYWYEKKYLNSVLEKEKLKAELLSLRAQIHPHFLFNTLNNIYSVTEKTSPVASEMLLRLSALLRYILYECNKQEILLMQEFKMVHDYLALETVRYAKDLDIQIDLPADTGNYLITPLLLLPLIENCFKHGVSKMIDQPWVNIRAELKEDILQVKIMNGCKESEPGNNGHDHYGSEGIGLINVRKRLALLYPGKHELKVFSEPGVFVVSLKLELNRIARAYEVSR